MTLPDALAEVLRLAAAATQGCWKVFEKEIPHYLTGSPHVARNIYTERKHPQLKSEYPIVCQATGIGATSEGPAVQFTNITPENAALLVAAVNFIRQHGSEIQAMADDARRLDWMDRNGFTAYRALDPIDGLSRHCVVVQETMRPRRGNVNDTIRGALDAAIDALNPIAKE